MKRLLGLLLVMGMVGCGGSVDGSKFVERDGLWYEGDSETPFTGAERGGYPNGQKMYEHNYKDGWPEGLSTSWHKNGQKKREATFKYGKRVSVTRWDKEGNEIKE